MDTRFATNNIQAEVLYFLPLEGQHTQISNKLSVLSS